MKILVGIQARSTSTRLPNKALQLICGVPILERVINSCTAAANVIRGKAPAEVVVAVLTPEGDPIAEHFRDRAAIVEGSEQDVLGRYMLAVDRYDPDLIVRVTGDCPLIPSSVIISLALLAKRYDYDYLSNVDDRFRTSADGTDCEVISRRLIKHVDEMARENPDREHVTTLIRRTPPPWAKVGAAVNHFDNSHIKLSVDTPDDLENVRRAFESAFYKYNSAVKAYGKERVHRI